MRYSVEVEGCQVAVSVRRNGDRLEVTVDDAAVDIAHVRRTGGRLTMHVAGRPVEAHVVPGSGDAHTVFVHGRTFETTPRRAAAASLSSRGASAGPAPLKAPMPGRIVRVLVSVGDEVTVGAGLVIMEAMKMENELRAPRAGRVARVDAVEGQAVETGALLVLIE